MTIRAISYGGGVQSTALVVLAAQGKIDYPLALFANVGDEAEAPWTVSYVEQVAIPWAAKHGIEVVELRRRRRDGSAYDLYAETARMDKSTIELPLREAGRGFMRRQCTSKYKIAVIEKELRKRGATAVDPAHVAVGISVDEFQRVNSRRAQEWEVPEYPLIDLGLTRAQCETIISDAGLPVPRRSACYFCPFHPPKAFGELRRDHPDLFERAAQLEDAVLRKRAARGKAPVYLTGKGRPLREAIPVAQNALFDERGGDGRCDEGYCWT